MSARIGPNRGGAIEKWAVRLIVPALFLALFMAMYWVAGPRLDWRAWFDGPERGTWRALTLNGEDVFDDKYLVTIADGAIVGGRDGCNYWSFAGIDERTGERIYESTLAGCTPTPAMAVYRVLAHGEADLRLESEDRLAISQGKCRGEFRRWTREDEELERARYEAQMEAQRRADTRVEAAQPVPSPAIPPPPSVRPEPPAVPPPPPPLPEPVLPGC